MSDVDDQGKMQARRYILTINNLAKSDEEFFEYCKGLEHVKYFIFQREKGEEKGTPHIQLFIQFTVGKRFGTVKNYFPTAHIEKVKGTNVQARDYCSKNDTRIGEVYEYGNFAEERSRVDIVSFLELIKSGADNDELSILFPKLYITYMDKVEKMRMEYDLKSSQNKRRFVDVTYIYGPAGTGKTSFVRDKHGDENCYFVSDYKKGPFDTYKGQDVLVFDEYNNQFDIFSLNKYLDIYPLELPARYNNRVAKYTKVYIISNFTFEQLFERLKLSNIELYNSVKRRIAQFYFFGKKGKYIVEGEKMIPLEEVVEIQKEKDTL